MYGSGRGVLPGIFDAHGIRYVAIRQEVNPLFPASIPNRSFHTSRCYRKRW